MKTKPLVKVKPKKRIKRPREHRFDCKVNADLFRQANVSRKETWPDLVESLFRLVISGDL